MQNAAREAAAQDFGSLLPRANAGDHAGDREARGDANVGPRLVRIGRRTVDIVRARRGVVCEPDRRRRVERATNTRDDISALAEQVSAPRLIARSGSPLHDIARPARAGAAVENIGAELLGWSGAGNRW